MKRLLCLALLLLAFPAQADESAYDRVMKSGVLRCGYGLSPPMLVQDPNTGELSGIDYDVAQALGKELGLKVEFTEEAGWGNFIEGLRTGRYDAFCSLLWPDPARTKFLSLIGPVAYDFLEAYVRPDDHRFDGHLEKLNSPEVTLPVIEGDVSVTISQSMTPQAKLLYLPQTATVSDMMESVATKKADAILLTPDMFADYDSKHPGALRKLENVPPSVVYSSYMAVNGGEIRLRDMLAVALRQLIDDGRLRKIADKYNPDYILPKPGY